MIGIFSRTFPGDADAAFGAASAAGYDGVHLSLSTLGLDSLPESVPAGISARVRELSRAHGLTVYGVSASCNLAHPSEAVRADGIRRAARVIAASPAAGIGFVSLCTGSRSTESMWEAHPDNATPEAWADARSSLQSLAATAEAHGVTIGVEPEPGNVVGNARLAERMLDEVASPAIRIILDPANLLSDGDGMSRQRGVLEEAFELLGPRTSIVHAKELDPAEQLAPGDGPVDFSLVFELVASLGRSIPVITHNLPAAAAARTADFLRKGLART